VPVRLRVDLPPNGLSQTRRSRQLSPARPSKLRVAECTLVRDRPGEGPSNVVAGERSSPLRPLAGGRKRLLAMSEHVGSRRTSCSGRSGRRLRPSERGCFTANLPDGAIIIISSAVGAIRSRPGLLHRRRPIAADRSRPGILMHDLTATAAILAGNTLRGRSKPGPAPDPRIDPGDCDGRRISSLPAPCLDRRFCVHRGPRRTGRPRAGAALAKTWRRAKSPATAAVIRAALACQV